MQCSSLKEIAVVMLSLIKTICGEATCWVTKAYQCYLHPLAMAMWMAVTAAAAKLSGHAVTRMTDALAAMTSTVGQFSGNAATMVQDKTFVYTVSTAAIASVIILGMKWKHHRDQEQNRKIQAQLLHKYEQERQKKKFYAAGVAASGKMNNP